MSKEENKNEKFDSSVRDPLKDAAYLIDAAMTAKSFNSPEERTKLYKEHLDAYLLTGTLPTVDAT